MGLLCQNSSAHVIFPEAMATNQHLNNREIVLPDFCFARLMRQYVEIVFIHGTTKTAMAVCRQHLFLFHMNHQSNGTNKFWVERVTLSRAAHATI